MGFEPQLRNKRRSILLTGCNYKELNEEAKQAIVKFMTFVPTISK